MILRELRETDELSAIRAAIHDVDGAVWMPDPAAGNGDPVARLVEVDGAPIGYAWMDRWSETDGTRLYLLLGFIVPQWRRRGMGGRLLAWQERQAAEQAARENIGTPVLGLNSGQAGAESLFRRHGYEVAFTGVTLECQPVQRPWRLPAGLELRSAVGADHRQIHDAITECFAGPRIGARHFPYIEYLSDFTAADLGLWQIAWEGEEIAGLAITTLGADGVADTPWVGVRTAWRRRGVARAILLTTLDDLARRGVHRATISTHLENTDNSVGLYESLGYRITERRPRFRKPLAPQLRIQSPGDSG